ncbi:MAG: acetyl-CoA carboxylase biotin carboxyl carrier protein subunit [Defluviicoccus sp.]|nr:acetyl-CoA carboxylase biotin carboxyl carrier protein subunit [Defluviicoccus sp.]
MPPLEIDEALIRRLASLLEETGLGEIEYADGDRRIRVTGRAAAAPAAAAAPSPAAAPQKEAPPVAAEIPEVATEDAVVAPMVGTVYVSPEPGALPFVQPGDTVAAGDTLLLIEAMKTFNPIRAPRAGRVARILVSDAAPVEFGEALIVLE